MSGPLVLRLQPGLTLFTRGAPQALPPARRWLRSRKRRQVEPEGGERADLRRPGVPQPQRVTLQMGKLRGAGGPGAWAPPRPGLDRPPQRIV